MEQTYAGLWEGLVTDINAPATELTGAVRVRVPQIHGTVTEVPDTALPWAAPNLMFAGTQCGIIGVPPVGAVVNLMFKQGDKNYPVWIGGSYKTGTEPPQYIAAKQGLTPKGWGFITPGGYGIFFDEFAKKITLRTPLTDLYTIEIDATAQTVTILTKTGAKLEMSDTAQKVVLQTAAGQAVELDDTSLKAILTGTFMEIGKGATEAAVLGTAFAQLWLNHGHPFAWAGPAGSGLTSGPVSPATAPGTAVLVPGTHLSILTKIK